jgi:hypothetical protein
LIVFNVRLLSELPLAAELARRYAAAGEAIAMCSETAGTDADAAVRDCATRLAGRYYNLESMTTDEAARREGSPMRAVTGLARRAMSRVVKSAPQPFERPFIDAFAAQHAAATAMLRDCAAGVLIVGQDGMSGPAPLIGAARDLGVPVVDCPYGFGTSRDFDDYLEEKAGEGSLHRADGPLGDRIKRECPQWVRRSRFGDVLMFAPEYVLARERFGLSLPLPWTIHGGAADLLAAESEAMYRHYLDEGIPATKVKLTGTVYCDVMTDRLTASPELMAAYSAGRKIEAGSTEVLISLPPSLHGIRAKFSEFDTYDAGCRAIIDMIRSKPGVSAVVSLHPNAPPEQRAFVEGLGVTVSSEWIVSLIPACDVFFTTFSSTIRWAIACGKPVLNYNMYSYNNHDYDAVEGVFTLPRLQEIEARFDQLLDDREYARVAARQKADGAQWGIMDGRNFERIRAAVSELRRSSPVEVRR